MNQILTKYMTGNNSNALLLTVFALTRGHGNDLFTASAQPLRVPLDKRERGARTVSASPAAAARFVFVIRPSEARCSFKFSGVPEM